ncbi:Peptide transport system permease protein sapC [Serratia rubidaea]|uniref:Peptide transport system permease protein sapC n=1 Tax=Serratia rubidaea TaxID=61652 RepID=A0A447QU40_SERRU|nr:Peptide transport system permease protein sapC [Serratia rubidaea]
MPFDNVYRERKMPSPLRYTWRIFYGDALAMIGFYGVIALVLLSLFGSLLAPYALDQQFLGYQLLPPSWSRIRQRLVLPRHRRSGTRPAEPSADRHHRHLRLGAGGDAGRRLSSGDPRGTGRRDPRPALGGAEPYSRYPAVDPFTAAGDRWWWRLSARNWSTPCWRYGWRCCRAWCAPSTARCMTSWKKSTWWRRGWTAPRLCRSCGMRCWPNIAAVLVTEFTRALSMAILDIAALGFLDLARSCRRRNGAPCSAIRCGAGVRRPLGGDAAARRHPDQRIADQPVGRWACARAINAGVE